MRRARRIAKWTGLSLALVVAAAWVVSLWWGCGYVWAYTTGHRDVGLNSGRLWYGALFPGPSNELTESSSWTWRSFWHGPTIDWLPRVESDAASLYISVPLWIPFVVLAIPAAWLFWSDRRARAGHCRCGYDLAGLPPDAACPECGRSETAKQRDSETGVRKQESGNHPGQRRTRGTRRRECGTGKAQG